MNAILLFFAYEKVHSYEQNELFSLSWWFIKKKNKLNNNIYGSQIVFQLVDSANLVQSVLKTGATVSAC